MTCRSRTIFAATLRVAAFLTWVPCLGAQTGGDDSLPSFDFRSPEVRAQWHAQNDIERFEAAAQGLRVVSEGDDPYFAGPAADFPDGQALFLKVRCRSESGGPLEVFYYRDHPRPGASTIVSLPAGTWVEQVASLPPLGPGTHLRLDPPTGAFELAFISFEPLRRHEQPAWSAPSARTIIRDERVIRSGPLRLRHDGQRFGAFVVEIDGQPMAAGHDQPWLGYLQDGQPRWLDLSQRLDTRVTQDGPAIEVSAQAIDDDGASWSFLTRFEPTQPGAIGVRCEIRVSQPRQVVHLPIFTLFPGLNSFGTSKGQGLFAGLEYLDDEPSSSTADVEGPAALRRVPDPVKITFPLMAIQAQGRYVGLIWSMQSDVAAVFDSPDRVYGSAAHLMGLVAPGASAAVREDGKVLPHGFVTLEPETPLEVKATLIGGLGDSVLPAVQQYVALEGLPPLPPTPQLQAYTTWAAQSWLDTPIREGALYRHAVGGDRFPAQWAADSAWMMRWLAAISADQALSGRLVNAADLAVAEIPPDQLLFTRISHQVLPVMPLVEGHVADSMAAAEARARQLLTRFDERGAVRYRARDDGPDYARTHSSDEASGLAASVVVDLLRLAAWCGKPELLEEALARLDQLDRFRGGVPRGAQTWECPLHTPDIYGSAHLVAAYCLGYELTAHPQYLESARYWAWSGVPFVYLRSPADGPFGAYATIAVLGATNWVAPIWLGKPVQWCGLVYAQSLDNLAELDPEGPWRVLADGIAASGIAQSYPVGHPHQGLLPDSVELLTQIRNGPDINPGTLQPPALRLLGAGPAYTLRHLPTSGLTVHAPGSVQVTRDEPASVGWMVEPWCAQPCYVLVNGVTSIPRVTIDGVEQAPGPDNAYLADRTSLILRLKGKARVELLLP